MTASEDNGRYPRGCCPFLRVAAECERLTGYGIVAMDEYQGVQSRIKAVVIASARDRHGCTGPDGVARRCPYDTFGHDILGIDPNVPLLRRRVEDGQDHKYI